MLPIALLLAAPTVPFKIKVVDSITGRAVPLVELRTTNHQLFITDSNGLVAINEPGLMNQTVFFHVKSHGYEFPPDGFGYRGTALRVQNGGSTVIKLMRLNIAERICRLTGEGIYRDSALLGVRTPLTNPTLNGQVFGQDSAQAVVYRGQMLWFWGDTDQPGYPLGNFQTTGAIASLPKGKTNADAGIEYSYFVGPNGFVRSMFSTRAPGAIWISGLTKFGPPKAEELYTYYSRMKSLGEKLEHGYAKWDASSCVFEPVRKFARLDDWRMVEGHPIRYVDRSVRYDAGGFCFPVVRVATDLKRYLEPTSYEAFTCLSASGDVNRDDSGRPLYRWQRALPPLLPEEELRLIKAGKLKQEEAHFLPLDTAGDTILPHGGNVEWNPWRKRWIAIFNRNGGKDSLLGEVYYSEANGPTGPWRRAVKVATHHQYSYYNPVHQRFLDTAGGRVIYFEGTYTDTFSGNLSPTPRYNYNQILYRLDLADRRLR